MNLAGNKNRRHGVIGGTRILRQLGVLKGLPTGAQKF